MGCSSCGVAGKGIPSGCGNKGSCSSGSCNKMNSFDWLTTLELNDPSAFNMVEISFKKGARKEFFINSVSNDITTGDMVVVESAAGYDVGRIMLSGELVRVQMKKKKVDESRVIHKVIRKAHSRDLEKLEEARNSEKRVLIKARQIARDLGLKMKIGDIEFQGDKRKATFYYTADGRVDFRELVRMYAKEFRVKIEMRQIGSRQESARIGGIGSCGRELCCSTWRSDFKTVNTSAARYQNLAINQVKLSGQCGRLKCCLNYELDMYVEAIGTFPKKMDVIRTKEGTATLMKMDIFKGLMYYSYSTSRGRGPILALDKSAVIELKEKIKKGEKLEDITSLRRPTKIEMKKEEEIKFEDVTGDIVLPELKRRKKKSKNFKKPRQGPKGSSKGSNQRGPKGNKPDDKRTSGPKNPNEKTGASKSRSKNYRSNKQRSNNNPENKNTTKKD